MIELIIAVIVFAIVSTVLAVTIATSVRILGAAKNREQIALDGEVAVTQFVRDFKMLTSRTSVKIAKKAEIKFDMKRGKTFHYKLSNAQLQVEEGTGFFRVLADSVNLDSSYFAYWDSNGTALTSFPLSKEKRKRIWRVQLTLDLQYNGQNIRFVGDVFPENLKFTEPDTVINPCSGGVGEENCGNTLYGSFGQVSFVFCCDKVTINSPTEITKIRLWYVGGGQKTINNPEVNSGTWSVPSGKILLKAEVWRKKPSGHGTINTHQVTSDIYGTCTAEDEDDEDEDDDDEDDDDEDDDDDNDDDDHHGNGQGD